MAGSIHIETTVRAELLGQTIFNVWHFNTDGAGGQLAMLPYSVAFRDHWLSLIKNTSSLALIYTNIHSVVRQGAAQEFDLPVNLNGNQPGSNLPSSMAINLRLTDSLPSLKSGSKRIAGLTDLMIAGNNLTTAAFNNLSAILTDMALSFTDLEGTTYRLETIHKRSGGVPLPSPVYTDVTAILINPVVTTQRSRRPRTIQ